MTWTPWLSDYFHRYKTALADETPVAKLVAFHDLAAETRAAGRKLMFAGNGASASIASHCAVDFTKQGRVRSVDFNEPNLLTCFSNDYGFENALAKAVEFYADPGDVLVLISVSGRSPNVVKAAECARERGLKVVSFTGSAPENPLRGLSDLDFWLNSKAYNVVECIHMMWLMAVVDMLVGKAEYAVA
ncbi:D-sedoheptulose 7-phosphate isomerase [Rhodoblastus acidophilus]|uniref:D-sedoheptulose 7-phosphate isomerase n=1 Tax=Rhodoblastus acidophilus TaxID=1074 RepID=A0A212Q2R1_RHOAC|nr:SIS domain-containing protein [Rhodoblastus acidophilus]PPQ37159.1 phosphoheptose isomerase [Rhodoblastus acidophilus]RAI18132.1 phosphoheptose isomerase [Rhodoblastus acidophilus]SNB53635.1 D-sedoheptulose 7-phosphate isomerase [Rhodoblastus acidophilus]